MFVNRCYEKENNGTGCGMNVGCGCVQECPCVMECPQERVCHTQTL